MKKHECAALKDRSQFNNELENRQIIRGAGVNISVYGEAIVKIEYAGDVAFAHCDEYATQINYCPFCGKKL